MLKFIGRDCNKKRTNRSRLGTIDRGCNENDRECYERDRKCDPDVAILLSYRSKTVKNDI